MDYPKMENKVIKISELREIFDAIFDNIDNIENQLGISSIQLNKDFYYCISNNFRYEMSSDPIGYGIGQLFDDYEFLKEISTDMTLATPLNLMHLAPLLDYMATEVDWYASEPRV